MYWQNDRIMVVETVLYMTDGGGTTSLQTGYREQKFIDRWSEQIFTLAAWHIRYRVRAGERGARRMFAGCQGRAGVRSGEDSSGCCHEAAPPPGRQHNRQPQSFLHPYWRQPTTNLSIKWSSQDSSVSRMLLSIKYVNLIEIFSESWSCSAFDYT